MTVITVKVSNNERSLKEKHLIMEDEQQIQVSKEDVLLNRLVQDAVKNFNDTPEDVTVNISLPW